MSDEIPADNVIYPAFATRLDIPVDRVLSAARGHGLKTVIIVGVTDDGAEYYASSTGDSGLVSLLLQRANLDVIENSE